MTDSGWEQVPRERLGLSSCMLSNACKEAFQEEAGFALHPEKKITQAGGSRRELPHRVRVGTRGRWEPRGADASGMHIAEGDKQGPRRPLSSRLLTPRGRAERGGQRSPGRAGPLKSFYHHWVGSKVCGGSDRPLPASHFFFFLSAAPLAFSRGRISTRPLLAGWAWAWLHHTPSGRGGPALGFLPLSGQADWRKTALEPSSKQETALPAS